MDREQLLTLALELAPEQRVALAEQLINSVNATDGADIEAAWSEEIRRRLERVDAGLATTVPWEEARRRIRAAAGLEPQD